MDIFKLIYSVLGGLGIFFYGMHTMSSALQTAAGGVIKKIINSLTSNRFLAVIVGVVVTMIIQSSSVTTVMVIGFVNAGIMQLTQAIGLILGANVGTTITGWIISINIGKYGLLLIGLGIFPALFAKNQKWRQMGRGIFGIGMIFFGLEIMSGAFKPLRTMPEFLDAISYFSGQNYGSYLASIAMGCLLTIVIQSSSAMLGITIVMATTGIIEFHTAAALVLGENIGTTITALLASVGGNVNAKRAARAHAVFNMAGVSIMLCIFPFYVQFIEYIIPGQANFINAVGDKPNIAVHIATGHTIFNVTATIIFIPLLSYIARFVIWITPDKETKEQHHLVMLGRSAEMLPATALIQARRETIKLAQITERMYRLTRTYLTGNTDNPTMFAKIQDYENITDNIQREITLFIGQLLEKFMVAEESREAQAIVRIADEFESVADYIINLAIYNDRFIQDDVLKDDAKEDFYSFYDKVGLYLSGVIHGVSNMETHDHSLYDRKADELRTLANSMRDSYLKRVANGDYSPVTILTYSDMIVALRKIKSHLLNVSEAIYRMKNEVDFKI